MKSQSHDNRHKKKVQLLILGLGCGILVLITMGCLFGRGIVLTGLLPQSIATEKLSAIKKGDLRDSALKVMADAWHHGECLQTNGDIDDVFLVGPREVNKMYVVVVTSASKDGIYRVTKAVPAERYLLKEYGFEKCIPKWVLDSISTSVPTK